MADSDDPSAGFREAFAKLVEEHVRVASSDSSTIQTDGDGIDGGFVSGLAAAGQLTAKKIPQDAAILSSELIRLLVVEAVMRAKKHAESSLKAREGPEHVTSTVSDAAGGDSVVITSQDVIAILPQLLLDFS